MEMHTPGYSSCSRVPTIMLLIYRILWRDGLFVHALYNLSAVLNTYTECSIQDRIYPRNDRNTENTHHRNRDIEQIDIGLPVRTRASAFYQARRRRRLRQDNLGKYRA